MTDIFSFASTTPRLGLPNLFTAQAQKEFTVNEAFALIDSLLHAAVEGEADAPPSDPGEGECWLVGIGPSGDWAGHSGRLACRQSGNWLFAAPIEGMTVYDRSTKQLVRFRDGWVRGASVAVPAGGEVIDVEARATLGELVANLISLGILPAS
ncbi:DUF2793 domain-containing protein [Aurantiacibacter zhengii]|uniref:DUF2793 domain-containing protein n=1 Tax=Aurantiacibacter zhengii TaxID=2307003 RepID=A0A418NSQ7_9SPHN|nr:DUF2793 domain-containing protein [Aurantiacibacter zhengii]RIV86670.1 DUF2793 domain-containing protein [Aurantiacibacter zhengii]